MPRLTVAQLQEQLSCWPGVNRYLVAYSGGLDSSVLLHAMARLCADRPWLSLMAVHVHHGLHEQADAWRWHCEKFCQQLKVPLRICFAEIDDAAPEGPEAAARNARYRLLEHGMQVHDALLMAHHGDDQLETLLMRLQRGAGVRGMAGIPMGRRMGPGRLLRPLLAWPRAALAAYAKAHKLTVLEDPSNLDERFERGYLRSQVLPPLRRRWPAAPRTAIRSAAHLRAAADLLDEVAAEDAGNLCKADGSLDLPGLMRLSAARRDNLLRYWIAASGFELPPGPRFETIVRELLPARDDAQPLVAWEGAELRRYRQRLFLMRPLLPVPPGWAACWGQSNTLCLPAEAGVLQAREADGCGLDPGLWASGDLQVRFRRGGETMQALAAGQHRKLSNWFQEQGVPPWVRERTPLVCLGEDLVAVADRWHSSRYEAANSGAGLSLEWHSQLPG